MKKEISASCSPALSAKRAVRRSHTTLNSKEFLVRRCQVAAAPSPKKSKNWSRFAIFTESCCQNLNFQLSKEARGTNNVQLLSASAGVTENVVFFSQNPPISLGSSVAQVGRDVQASSTILGFSRSKSQGIPSQPLITLTGMK